MHSPLRYAADQLLVAELGTGLADFIAEAIREGWGDQVAAVKLAARTGGVIVIDRRTMHNWLHSS